MAFNMDNSERPLTAKEKRQEQLRRWESSATDEESAVLSNLKPKVKFHDGAVFLAACSSGDLDEVQVLLDKGADINFANVDGLTALHQACIDGNLDVVEFLVEHGTDIDQQDNEGWTPLHAAASCGFMDIARYLVDNHANVAAVNSEGEVPLDIAEDDEMLEFLQQEIDNQGLDVESARNEEQETMIADAKQYLNSMHNGDMPSIYRHPKSGATALHVAAAKGYIDVIRLLLQSGMDVNLRDNDGWTPLHAASHWSQQEAAKLLADRGANFQSRSNLGQAPCDVADEDMLEYMRDLQKESRLQHKESELIKPPPSTNIIANKPRTEVRQEVVVTEKFNSIRNNGGMDDVSRISAAEKAFNRDTMINSSSDSEDEDSTSSSEAPVKSSKPPLETRMEYTRSEIRRTGSSENVRVEETTTITHSESGGNVRAGFAGRRTTRPASLHISSTATNKDVRPPIMSAQELSSTRPVAATQPVQSVKSNGPDGTPVTPTERNSDIKEGAPATWRLGLRKTGSFDDKMRMGRPPPGSTGTPGRPDGSNAGGKTQEEFKTSKTDSATRTARVTPIIDARVPAKNRTTNKEEENTSGFQRTGSYRAYSNDSALSSTNAPISYKRSVEETPDVGSKETVTNMLNAIDARPDRRRSHLQPVRDEEAEAQRKARSRRERQTRRSTQGVTLDVFEEAKRTIDNMKQERSENASASKQAEDSTASNDTGRIPHNDSLSTAHRRFNAGGPHSNPRNVTLPSGYIPSNERVQNKAKQPPISTVVPSINIENNDEKQDEEKQDTEDGGDEGNSLTPGGQSPSARKSAAQQRRRQRKERRSTGLPGLKPSSTADSSDKDGREKKVGGSSDLDWLRGLGKVSGKFRGDSNASGDFMRGRSAKFNKKRRSVMGELHPKAIRNEYYGDSLSPMQVVGPLGQRGGYMQRGLVRTPYPQHTAVGRRHSHDGESPCLIEARSAEFVEAKPMSSRPQDRDSPVSPTLLPHTSSRIYATEPENQINPSVSDQELNSMAAVLPDRHTDKIRSLHGHSFFLEAASVMGDITTIQPGSSSVKNIGSDLSSVSSQCSTKTKQQNLDRKLSNDRTQLDVDKVKRRLDFTKLPSDQNGSDDDETFKNDIDADDTKADRLKTTAARYDSSSLPDRHSRHRSGGLRGSDNDLPSRFAAPLDDRKTDEKDYKKLFEDSRDDNERLQRELEDAKRRVAELESRLERADDVSARRKAAETEKRALERKLAEAEKELMNSPNVETLRAKNIELAQENQALTRLVSKLGGGDDKPTRSLVDTFSVAGGDTEPKSKPINDDVERKTSEDLPRRSSYTKYGSDTLSSVSSSRDQSPSYRSGYGDSGRRGLSKSSSSTLDNSSYTARPSSAYRSLKDKHSSAYSKFTTPTSYSAPSSRSHYSSITPSSPLSTRSKLTTSKSYTKPDTYTSYRNRNFDSLSKSRSSNFPTSANSKRVGTLLDTYRGASIKP